MSARADAPAAAEAAGMLARVEREGAGPTIVFLPGYASDMQGAKALALDAWAVRTGRAMIRFDYSGCGASPGAFADQAFETWFGDTMRIIDASEGPLVLVGSSMGGWLMLLAAMLRAERVAGLVGIAAAPDFTDWGFSDAEKEQLMRGTDLRRPSPYGEPLLTTARFWSSGQAMRLPRGELAIGCPVRLLHGQKDAEVPFAHSLSLADRLRTPDVRVTLVKDGDHRLSRAQDLALLVATVDELVTSCSH